MASLNNAHYNTHFLDLGMSKKKKKKKNEEQLFNRIVAAKLNWRLMRLSLARVTSLERELTPLFAGLAMRQSVCYLGTWHKSIGA